MKQKLLLTSGGLPPEIKPFFLSCLSKPPEEISISYITTAAYGEGDQKPAWLQIYKNQLRECGIKQIEDLDIKGKNQTELGKILSDKDVIFMNGGNSFYLLYWVKQSGFDKLIAPLLDRGKLYVGISAGSYIACPTIEQATWKHQDKNIVGLTDLTALNLVPFLITAHFQKKYRSIINQAIKTTKYPVVGLTDSQAVLVEDDKYKVVGVREKIFFNGFIETYAI